MEILGTDWPALMYDVSKRDPEDMRKGFLQSRLMLNVSLPLAPSSASPSLMTIPHRW